MANPRTPSKATRPKANTVKWWLMKLPEPIRSKALKACDNPDRKVNSVAHAIADGFSWVDTKEGDAYWLKVRNLAEAGEFDPKKSPSKSKTPAPKKKKPTQLDRIEKKLDTIHRTVVVRADSIHATLVDTKRSIGSIESKLATLNAWETLNEAMSKDKLASPTVAVEEKWVPKVGEWVVCDLDHSNDHNHNPYWAEEMSDIVGRPLLVYGIIDGDVVAGVNDEHSGRWCWNMSWLRPATPEEIAAHEAKLKAEAQAAEDAKLVFGARVMHEGKEFRLCIDRPANDGEWLLSRKGANDAFWVPRNDFTLLP